jgi:hypothetical protein
MCKTQIDLRENQGGLVFDDQLFVCETCTSHNSEEDLMEWSTKMLQHSGSGMPIALWLIHENNRDKPLFTKRRI